MHDNARSHERLVLRDRVLNRATLDYYGLVGDPFNAEPSPHPYIGPAHAKALAALYYHLEQGAKIPVLIGPSGVGKTTALRLVEKRERARRRTLLVSSAPSDVSRLEREILGALGINSFQPDEAAAGAKVHELLAGDAAPCGNITLFVDDAQDLNDVGLKLIGSLSPLQVRERNNLKLVLAGSTELENRLSLLELEGILEPVPLAPLAPVEIEAYTHHRLRLAGGAEDSIFLADACAAIAARTDGIPKKINEICSAILEVGARHQVRLVDAAWLDANDIPAGTIAPGDAVSSEPVSTRRDTTNTCVAIFTIVLGTALSYILHDQLSDLHLLRPSSSKVSFSLPRTVDRKMRYAPNAGSSSSRSLNTVGPTKAENIRVCSPESARPVAASEHKVPAADSLVEEVASPSLNSPVLPCAPHISVESFGSSSYVPERSGVTLLPRTASITTDNTPRSYRDSHELATVNPACAPNNGGAPDNFIRGPLLGTSCVPNASRWSSSIEATANAENASDQILVGDAYMRLGEYGQALAHYKDALGMTPDNKEVQQKVSQARGAEAVKESALINREKTSVAIRLGDMYLLRGDYEHAISTFEGALKYMPGSRELQDRLQRAFRAQAAEHAIVR